jgi:hypothetical protein
VSEESRSALALDRAIDRLLRDEDAPAAEDDGLLATARLLRQALPPLHPRFGFEAHLATRLAAAGRATAPAPLSAEPIPLRTRLAAASAPLPSEAGAAVVAATPRRRSLVAGGAIASGVSLAGAALVVWRRNRSGGPF